MDNTQIQNSFKKGLKDGLPIGLGYFSVSFTFGMMAVSAGIPVWAAVLISMTNLTSAGQFAGLSIIAGAGSLVEMAMTQLVINARYSLMSLTLSQKMEKRFSIPKRLIAAFSNTDEIFAVAVNQGKEIGAKYYSGLSIIPYAGWTLGTLFGAVAGGFLPQVVNDALGLAIYAMFIAIIIPPAKKSAPIRLVIFAAVILSCLFYFVPFLKNVSSGFSIIICAVAASIIAEIVNPVNDDEPKTEQEANE